MTQDERPNNTRRPPKLNRFATAAVPALLTLAACTAKPPQHENQRFVPVSRAMQSWGALEFNNRELHLEALSGDMQLEYVGALSEQAGEDLSGAAVYRIKNADKYFKLNQSTPDFCTQPVRWVALNSTTGAPAWSSEITFALLTIDDWSKYAINTGGYCAGGKYVRAGPQ